MSKSTSYVIRYAGQYESALAACRCPIKTTRYESVVMAERDIAMVREGDTAALLAAQVSVRGDDGWYVYASQDDADADDDGSSAIAVIESKRIPSVCLTADGMGDDATEADYDAFIAFVSERIDERCGFAVEVDSNRYGFGGETVYRGDESDRETVRRAHDALWEEFCATPEAWPSASAEVSAEVSQ